MPEPVLSLGSPPGGRENRENVENHFPAYPSKGFGQLWKKALTIEFDSSDDAEHVMRDWREHLAQLWPRKGQVYLPGRSIQPGDLMGVDVSLGPVTLSTGVVVIESSATALTLLSPQGHMFAGWTRLATAAKSTGRIRASVTIEMRSGDPLYELGLMFGGHRSEERFWAELLCNLASGYGHPGRVQLRRQLADKKRQWRAAANIRHNALIRSWLRKPYRLIRISR